MLNDSKQGGNKVTLATFEKWDKDRGLKEIFGFKTSTVDNCVYVTEVWCKVCAAQQHHFANHPNLKGQVLDSSVKRFIDGTNNVKKSALDRHMDTSAAHKIAMEHHKPSTSQRHQEVFI